MSNPKCLVKKIKSGKFKNQYRFTLHGLNGKVIGTSGSETYHNKTDLVGTVEKYFPNFTIIMPVEDNRQRNHKPPVKAPDKATTQKAKDFALAVITKAEDKIQDGIEEQLRGTY